ncbi:Phosphate propanoyltransferase [uncultured Roseburia sp.]|uniref:Phosphate propanoyltransferase n=1 Tax=Brotonthovivens ammoniilytica TaxID=2981725 RepID=A0ABT2TF34_9FIRM|nr:phosphate propanoyltransferase [Brotonthovivens ammoniilytica]MCU6760794.1 phosphate propanoyltransferase [Brotonthovivens ammoniilytica]SCI09503.1 Phosphate propanoyltransferase [uncultured Roseburia sp.]
MNEAAIKQIVASVIANINTGELKTADTVPVEVSARHVHLSQADVERLFGPGHTLTSKRALSQPGQFLAEERVSIVTAKGEFRNVAVLGPARAATQVELSMTDAKALGVSAPIRQSGDVKGSPDICIFSKNAMIQAKEAVIVAQNHIHMTPQDAAVYGVFDGQRVRVRMNTSRPLEFDDVVIRVNDSFQLAMHIDFDEANACAFEKNNTGTLKA